MVCLGRPYYFKYFKGSLPQILLGQFLSTLTHMFSSIFRWYSFVGSIDGGNFNEKEHNNICPPELRFCDKLKVGNAPSQKKSFKGWQ